MYFVFFYKMVSPAATRGDRQRLRKTKFIRFTGSSYRRHSTLIGHVGKPPGRNRESLGPSFY